MYVCSSAVYVVMGFIVVGRRELFGVKLGDNENEGFWSQLLGSLKERSPTALKHVIDANSGLPKATYLMLHLNYWQLCSFIFSRNLIQTVP